MNKFIDNHLLYFTTPVFVAVFFLLLFFNIPSSVFEGVVIFLFMVIVVSVLGKIFFPRPLGVVNAVRKIKKSTADILIIAIFSLVVLLSGPVDIYINGFKLLQPDTYADFIGVGRFVRHFSSLCWLFVPIAFLFVKNKKLKVLLVAYAIIFPILIIDRNRLLLSLYALFFCHSILYNIKRPWFFYFNVIALVLFVFSLIGFYRSGDSFVIDTSGSVLIDGYYPLKEYFFYFPRFAQQIILYISTPIFNFGYIYSLDFKNSIFLISQISPFSREQFELYPYSPILVPRFNVGTEFFPQLMYGGVYLVCLSLVFMLIVFMMSVFYLKKAKNIFSLLIFLKVSHTVLFMGFAPQFYILLNFAFLVVMFFLHFCSMFLNASFIEYSSATEGGKYD